jgi:hypothetical protein
MDIAGDDCFAIPIPHITSSGGKSFNQSGVVIGPAADAGAEPPPVDPHPAAKSTRERTMSIEQAFFIIKLLLIISYLHTEIILTDLLCYLPDAFNIINQLLIKVSQKT